jgi:hypothetical protein
MASSKDKIRNITGASIELGVPVTTLRRWDPILMPLRIGSGPNSPRGYDDARIERAKKLVALNEKS